MSNTVLAIIEMERFPREVARRSAWIAQHYGCDLELVFSDPTLGFLRDSFMISADSQQIADSIRQAQDEELESLSSAVAAPGLTVTTSIITDRPASDAIVAKALECEPTFVVKGTAYHSPAERATFTFTDWQLIRKLDYPLWLVKPQDWKEKPVIVAAVDPMHRHDKERTLDQAIVDAGKTLAAKCDGELHLLHTYERLNAIGAYTKLKFIPRKAPIHEIEEKMRAEYRRHLDSLAAKNEIEPNAIHQLPGRTRDILPTFARANGADLVIMGALARTGLKRRIIGSTAEQVLDHLHCDILIARAP
ncbi:MAG: universal stress protein [Gammaproteobacteria bacterium]|nr:universal stress protein [Gammaproteobacteria bacterium]MDH3751070.1 universal stress protein [Gammaproteobacteria bacterium]MDH3806182.1 universal stress protein [Gammaproteobacteria bacterium]